MLQSCCPFVYSFIVSVMLIARDRSYGPSISWSKDCHVEDAMTYPDNQSTMMLEKLVMAEVGSECDM